LVLEDLQFGQFLAQNPEFTERFPHLLRKARENAGLSVRALGRRAHVDPTFISRLERRLAPPPRWPTLKAIVAALPDSELAQIVWVASTGKFRQSVLNATNDLQRLIASLPTTTFIDRNWVAVVKHQLRKCMMLMDASQQASRRK
jgi:transcriptional regulator with XRE-family HTH domain